MTKTITRDELKKLIDEKGEYILVDVREPFELTHGIIPTSKNIPMGQFPEALDQFNKQDRIIFYCRSGGRSAIVTEMALDQGFNAVNYVGSILEWANIDPNVEKY